MSTQQAQAQQQPQQALQPLLGHTMQGLAHGMQPGMAAGMMQGQLQPQEQGSMPMEVRAQELLPVKQPPKPLDPLAQSTGETWLSIASLAETLGDADRAAMAYDATLQHNPSSTKALTSLAHLYRSRDMFQRAAELYQRALSVNPELGDIWATLGHCYLMLDELQSAYAAYQQALYHLSNPNIPKLWHGIGILYDRYGSLDYAEEAFAKVLELDPQFEKANEIYFRLGIIYKHQGKWNQALECFRYILPQPPAPLQEWDVWFQLGSVLESMGEWQGARDAYEYILSQNDRHAKVLQQLGCLYGMNNVAFYDPEKALNLLLKSLEIDSTDATSWYHLGRIHMIRNDYTSAYDAFQQAVNRDSRNPTFWCSIGVLYYQIAQYRDALDAYTRAIRLNPYISEVWYDLGTLYETCNNQINDALDAYKQAARLDPNNVHIRKRLEALTAQIMNPPQSNDQQHQNVEFNQQSVLPLPSQLQQQSQQQQLAQSTQQQSQPVMLQPTLQNNSQTFNPLNNKQSTNIQDQPDHSHYQQTQGQQTVPLSMPSVLPSVEQSQYQHTKSQVQIPSQQQQLQPLSVQPTQPLPPVQNSTVASQTPQQTIPQKRPLEGGMDTLFNAISQQEQEQLKQNQADESKITSVVTQPKRASVALSADGDDPNSSIKNEPGQANKGSVAETDCETESKKPLTGNTPGDNNAAESVPSKSSEKSVSGSVADINEPAFPNQKTIDVQEPTTTQPSLTEQIAVVTPSEPTAQTAGKPDAASIEQHITNGHGAENTEDEKPNANGQVVEPAIKGSKVDSEETLIKPSVDAIESIKEQEKIRQEEENETKEKLEKVAEPFSKDKIVREVEEDEDYDE